MANKHLFGSSSSTVLNNAGGVAYKLSDEEALVQLVVTGCFADGFYSAAVDQLKETLALLPKVSTELIAKVAVYAREDAYMKDSPALLLAYLMGRDNVNFKKAFNRVLGTERPERGSGKVLRNFVQIVRSGMVGKRSLTRGAMKCINTWLNNASDELLFQTYVGANPSLRDILRLSHPKPKDEVRENLFGWIVSQGDDKGKMEHANRTSFNFDLLPPVFQNYLKFKMGSAFDYTGIPFRMLTSKKLEKHEWIEIAKNMSWHELRQNLNTLERHGVFEEEEMVQFVYDKLTNPNILEKVKAFPYQTLTTAMAVMQSELRMTQSYWERDRIKPTVPSKIIRAVSEVLEHTLKEVPVLKGRTLVAVDVSGSMGTPVTGMNGKPSIANCADVAGLMAASLFKKNPDNIDVLLFDTEMKQIALNPMDTLIASARSIYTQVGGGTDVSLVYRFAMGKAGNLLIGEKRHVVIYDNIIVLSDNESWVRNSNYRGTSSQQLLEEYRKLVNPNVKVINVDMQPGTTTQTPTDTLTMNIGGFSDQVYNLIDMFINGNQLTNKFSWVEFLNQKVEL